MAAVREILPIAVAMLPVNAAVYVFDGIITGAADFKFMAGGCWSAAQQRKGVGCAQLCASGWQRQATRVTSQSAWHDLHSDSPMHA
jgi:hypothetical protein